MRIGTFGVASIALSGILAPACGGGAGVPAGQEGGPCYGNGSCDAGLTCASMLCVRLGGGGAGGRAGTTGSGGNSGASGGDPCPTGSFVNCATDCGGMEVACGVTWSAMDRPCGFGTCPGRVTTIAVVLSDGHYRISVSPPWVVVAPPVPGEPACPAGAPCIIHDAYSTTTLDLHVIGIVTTDPTAPPRNVVIEPVPSTVTTCN
jgi:hypothetical protein